MIDHATTILQLRHVAMAYGGPEVLSDINLTLKSGSFHFLVGPSGVGKTTLLKLISLADKPTRGSIALFGRQTEHIDRREAANLRQQIGIVFQDFKLLDHLSAFDNVALPLRILGRSEDEVVKSISKLMAWLDLGSVMELRPPELSMGQRQLVTIGRAVARRPRLLLCDEPTSNLDAKRAQNLMRLFVQLNRVGTAVLLVTHSTLLLRRAEFPVLRLSQGRLMQIDQSERIAA